jgi:prepilin-type N-terminal cleavage/methylation domain-containing protein
MTWGQKARWRKGFTLIELLVVMAVIAILAGLLLPALAGAKRRAQRATCMNNVKQINLAIQLYAGDNHDTLPSAANVVAEGYFTNEYDVFYKAMVKSYVGLHGTSSPQDRLFACPADIFYYDERIGDVLVHQSYHDQPFSDYSSYAYNGLGQTTDAPPTLPDQTDSPGVAGMKLAAIKEQAKTVLVGEESALYPWSWHNPQSLPAGECAFNNAKNVLSFVDGHVDYVAVYFNTDYILDAIYYDPPAGYDYKWRGD